MQLVKFKSYKNIETLAKKAGLCVSSVRRRLRKGYTVTEVLNIKAVTKARPININGKNFKSLTQACIYYNKEPRTVAYRIKSGMSKKEAFDLAEKKYNTIIVKGKGFKCLNHACRYYKFNFNTVNSRLKRGWSLEEALEIVKRKNSSKCEGKLYVILNYKNNLKYVGITSRSLKSRFQAHTYQAKKGKDTKLYNAMRLIGINNFYIELLKESNDWSKLRKLEMKYINTLNTIKQGYNTATGGNGSADRCGVSVTYQGNNFISIKALAEFLGINKSTVEWRLKRGISFAKPLRVTKPKS